MKLKVIGSSGALPFPKPNCSCSDCKKAGENGIPYERISSSLFVYPDILIDTPEEVCRRLIRFGIENVRHVFYTHWHPDHTQGSRIFEMLARSGFMGKRQNPPVKVYLPKGMISDFRKYLKIFDFYEKQKYIEILNVDDRKPVRFGKISITPINLKRKDRVRYAFLIEGNGKRVMYAPCSIFATKFDDFWKNLDVLLVETGWHGDTSELRKKKVEPFFKDHISLEENFKWLEILNPKKMILTHLEGCLHQTYDMIRAEAKKYPGVDVAYDGMEIELE